MKYLSWYQNKANFPEWIASILVYVPYASTPQYLIQNLPLYGYNYDLRIGQRRAEEVLADHSAVEMAIPLTPDHQKLRLALVDEMLVNVNFMMQDVQGNVLREIIFGICNIVHFKEEDGEIRLTFNYDFYSEALKTPRGVMASDINFGEYTHSTFNPKDFKEYWRHFKAGTI